MSFNQSVKTKLQPTRSLTVRSGTRGSDARCPSLPIYVGDAHDCDHDWDLPKTSTSQTAKGGDAKRSHKLLAGGAKLLPFVVDLDIISFTFATIVLWSQLSKFLEGSAARTNTHLLHPLLLSPSPHPHHIQGVGRRPHVALKVFLGVWQTAVIRL